MTENNKKLIQVLERLCSALEAVNTKKREPEEPARIAELSNDALNAHDGFIWNSQAKTLHPVPSINRTELDLLLGIDLVKEELYGNTLRFAQGLSANNALLWGARGMGKSSLVKAVHAAIIANPEHNIKSLKLVEINREDISTLPQLMTQLKHLPQLFILFCDDLSFGHEDNQYKDLKTILEGGLEGRPHNVIFYATSNRRHLMNRSMIENEQSTAINPYEAVEEKVSLSDRFGLWLGFHACDQNDYIAMIKGYAEYYSLIQNGQNEEAMIEQALAWSRTRGSRSGRVAWQFIQDWAGRHGQNITTIMRPLNKYHIFQ